MFRNSFQYGGRINWFTGHMIHNRRKLQETIKMIDVVLEVRDARAPLSTEFPLLDELLGTSTKKSRVIVFNKADLSNLNILSKIRDHIESKSREENKPVPLIQFTQSIHLDQKTNIKHPINLIKNAAQIYRAKNPLPENYTQTPYQKEINMLVVGLPNVGKSTLINAVRAASGMKKSARMGSMPGVTRYISGFQACSNPPTFLVDTPGIMVPGNMEDIERGLTLCLLGMISDKIVEPNIVADFLLYKLCQINKTFVTKLGISPEFLQTHGDDINPFLLELCKTYNMYLPSAQPDLEKAAKFFISKFRNFEFGPLTLDFIVNKK